MSKKIAVISLGCDKNRVDTESMLYFLSKGGHEITTDFDVAQVIIVNTCAFIEAARMEAIENILKAVNYKEQKKCEKLIVTGCLPQKYRENILQDLPEVDAFMGTNEYLNICKVIEDLYASESTGKNITLFAEKPCDFERIVTTPAHYAYLKIAEGCDNFCTFCTIPSIRGKYVSKPKEKLLAEAKALADDGVKELILVAQDVTKYGFDLYGKYALVELLQALSKLNFVWIRLLYCYPELVSNELIHEININDKIAKYIDIPLQHVDNDVLKRMNRRSTYEGICSLFYKLRNEKNHIAIRTTVMVGFPGETDEQFNRMADFLRQFKPDHVGVFAYSKEDDTPSAKLNGHLSKKIKAERVKTIGEIHYKNCLEKNRNSVGKTVQVLYEDIDYERNLFKGRTQYNAPNIDTDVYFKTDFADIGNIYEVVITDSDGYDLIGEVK